MSLHRIQHIDGTGRRSTRYVERRGDGGSVGVVIENRAKPAPRALKASQSPSGADQVDQAETPIAAPAPFDTGPEVDLEDTETVIKLRREIAELRARTGALERRVGELEARPAAAGGDPVELGRHAARLSAIEGALAALGAAAEVAAQRDS